MPIPIICPGCKSQFRVSDKFAGKQGPCPKCKTLINVPKLDEITIHTEGPAAVAGKPPSPDATPRPIRRQKMRLSGLQATIVGGAIVAVQFIAWIAGDFLRSNVYLSGLGLLVVSIPLCL